MQPFVLEGHTHQVTSVAVSPDGQWIISGSADRTTRVWDASSGAQQFVLQGHTAVVNTVAFSPDSQRIVSGSGDGTVRVWDTATGSQLSVLKRHTSEVSTVAVSADGRWIVSGSYDMTVRVWNAVTGLQKFVLKGHAAVIYAVAISPDGQWIVSGSGDGTARLWDASTGVQKFVLQGHTCIVRTVAVSPDSRWIVSGSVDKTVRVWDAATGRQQSVLDHNESVTTVVVSPDGRWIRSGSENGTVRVWDAAASVTQHSKLEGRSAQVGAVASRTFYDEYTKSPVGIGDDETLAPGGNTEMMWSERAGPIEQYCAALNPDGRTSGAEDRQKGRKIGTVDILSLKPAVAEKDEVVQAFSLLTEEDKGSKELKPNVNIKMCPNGHTDATSVGGIDAGVNEYHCYECGAVFQERAVTPGEPQEKAPRLKGERSGKLPET
ncbi:hypothetical protein HK405_009108, partial [Cladochytrium tenue]